MDFERGVNDAEAGLLVWSNFLMESLANQVLFCVVLFAHCVDPFRAWRARVVSVC